MGGMMFGFEVIQIVGAVLMLAGLFIVLFARQRLAARSSQQQAGDERSVMTMRILLLAGAADMALGMLMIMFGPWLLSP